MITVSLKQILAANPCQSGWAKVLHARGKMTNGQLQECLDNEHVPMSFSKLADDEQFPMSSIIESNSFNDCVWTFRCVNAKELQIKFAVWCARQVQYLMKDQRSIDALDVVWRYSDGLVTDEELVKVRRAADAAYADAAAAYAARTAAYTAAYADAYAARAARAAADADAADAVRQEQEVKLKQILDAGCWV